MRGHPGAWLQHPVRPPWQYHRHSVGAPSPSIVIFIVVHQAMCVCVCVHRIPVLPGLVLQACFICKVTKRLDFLCRTPFNLTASSCLTLALTPPDLNSSPPHIPQATERDCSFNGSRCSLSCDLQGYVRHLHGCTPHCWHCSLVPAEPP